MPIDAGSDGGGAGAPLPEAPPTCRSYCANNQVCSAPCNVCRENLCSPTGECHAYCATNADCYGSSCGYCNGNGECVALCNTVCLGDSDCQFLGSTCTSCVAGLCQPTPTVAPCLHGNWSNPDYIVRSIGYSPTPVGNNVLFQAPYGDFFTVDYAYLYERDLPLIKAMGANTIRLWQWQFDGDHEHFLNTCLAYDLHVIVSFPFPYPSYEQLHNATWTQGVLTDFATMIALHMHHPAIIMWLIGDELNNPPIQDACCQELVFDLVNEMVTLAHDVEGNSTCRPVSSPLADLPLANSSVASFNFDILTLQIYRGCNFTTLWDELSAVYSVSNAPWTQAKIVVTEFGIDAYDDLTGLEYQAVQAKCYVNLLNELAANTQYAFGGSIMEYSDEWWKATYLANTCQHTECESGDNTATRQGYCGFNDTSSPDNFKNEAWWGMMQYDPFNSACLTPRYVYLAVRETWAGTPLGAPVCTSNSHGNLCCHSAAPIPVLALNSSLDLSTCQDTIPRMVNVSGRQLFVDGQLYNMRGVRYSPVPIGANPQIDQPLGDYFTDEYSGIYMRDLPLLAAMGANTLIVQLASNARHGGFLNEAWSLNISVIVEFFVNPSNYLDTLMISELQYDFEELIRLHGRHPAILMWCVGEEVNLNFPNQLPEYFYMVTQFKNSINLIELIPHPVIVSLGDGINMWSTVQSFNGVPDLWGFQLYPGQSFGSFFDTFYQASTSPMAILAFGMDAYAPDVMVGEAIQTSWVSGLWWEIANNNITCSGGVIMEWTDEWWKGAISNSGGIDCANNNATYQYYQCGEANINLPGGFLSTQYLGINALVPAPVTAAQCILPRQLYFQLMCTWAGNCQHLNMSGEEYCQGISCCAPSTSISLFAEILTLFSPTLIVISLAPLYYLARYISARRRGRPVLAMSKEIDNDVNNNSDLMNASNALNDEGEIVDDPLLSPRSPEMAAQEQPIREATLLKFSEYVEEEMKMDLREMRKSFLDGKAHDLYFYQVATEPPPKDNPLRAYRKANVGSEVPLPSPMSESGYASEAAANTASPRRTRSGLGTRPSFETPTANRYEQAGRFPSRTHGKDKAEEVSPATTVRSTLEDTPQFWHLLGLVAHEAIRSTGIDSEASESEFKAAYVQACEVVHNRILEGYYAWAEYSKVEVRLLLEHQRLRTAMQWLLMWEAAGSLRHCPELLCALFHQAIDMWEGMSQSGTYWQWLHEELRTLDSLTRRAAKEAATNKGAEFNFDDLNEYFWAAPPGAKDAYKTLSTTKSYRGARRGQGRGGTYGTHATPEKGKENKAGATERDSLLGNDEEDGEKGLEWHAAVTARANIPPKTFPEKGGWLAGVIYNFFFIFHFKVLALLVVMQSDPIAQLPYVTFVELLASVDAACVLVHSALHIFVLGYRGLRRHVAKHKLRALGELLWCGFAGVTLATAWNQNMLTAMVAARLLPRWLINDSCATMLPIRYFLVIYLLARALYGFLQLFVGHVPIGLAGRVPPPGTKRRRDCAGSVGFVLTEALFWLLVFLLEYIFVKYILEPNTVPAVLYLCDSASGHFATFANCWAPRIAMAAASLLGYLVYTNVAYVFVSVVVGLASASFYERIGVYQDFADVTQLRVRQLLMPLLPGNVVDTNLSEGRHEVVETVSTLYPGWPKVLMGDEFDTDVPIGDPLHVIWATLLSALYNDDILTSDEAKFLRHSFEQTDGINLRPRSKEAQRRLLFFLSSLATPHNWSKVDLEAVRAISILIPVYDETIVFSSKVLRHRTHTDARGDGTDFRVADMEYLVACYPDEWQNFHARLTLKYGKHYLAANDSPGKPLDDAQKLLGAFMRDTLSNPAIETEIRLWASFRGQTLARTVKGAFENVKALKTLMLADPRFSNRPDWKDYIDQLSKAKVQVLVTYQTFDNRPNPMDKAGVEARAAMLDAMDILRTRFPSMELAYVREQAGKDKAPGTFMSILENIEDDVPVQKYVVRRFGPMKIGQGKAENQNHAIVFATGEVMQTLDMNQENYFEEALKMPYLTETLYKSFHRGIASKEPVYRVVGFREYPFTERLGMVGRYMGYAEWTFGTIVQRVLSYLKVRLHYGHPDVWDAYWAKTRYVSKASNYVNVNEDIFAGYELLARGEKVTHVEFIQVGKGRETSFASAHVFETKLATGAALQLMSRDVYRLNRSLHFFHRLSLFYGSIGFYVNNAIMTYSIWMFMFTILLLTLTGHSAHQIGTLGSSLAVEWFVQMGYVYALPLLAQMVIESGVWGGVAEFLIDLPLSTMFFVFHMRTKAYYFEWALATGSGSWLKTGRGFGLKRSTLKEMYMTYADSHFHFALNLFLFLVLYYTYDNQGALAQFFKTWSIVLAFLSWMFAPVIFNPFTSLPVLQKELSEFTVWLTTDITDEELTRLAAAKALSGAEKEYLEQLKLRSWAAWWMDRYLTDWAEPRNVSVWTWRARNILSLVFFRLVPWTIIAFALAMQVTTIEPVTDLLLLAVQTAVVDFILTWGIWHSRFKSDRGVIKAFYSAGAFVYALMFLTTQNPTWTHGVIAVIVLFMVSESLLIVLELFVVLWRRTLRALLVRCCGGRCGFPTSDSAVQPGMTILLAAYRLDAVTILHKGIASITIAFLFLAGLIFSAIPSLHTTLLYNESVARTWTKSLNENPTRARRET